MDEIFLDDLEVDLQSVEGLVGFGLGFFGVPVFLGSEDGVYLFKGGFRIGDYKFDGEI